MSTHANRGKPFEEALEDLLEIYRARGHVAIRFPTPYKVISRTPRGLLVVPERKAAPDFLLVAHGLDVLADAKSTAETRWPLARLDDHQADAFDRWVAQGGQHRAGVILRLGLDGGGRRDWWIDWRTLGPIWWAWKAGNARRGEASLTADWLDRHAIPVVGMDWIGAILKAES